MISTGARRDLYDRWGWTGSFRDPGSTRPCAVGLEECALLDDFAGAVRRGEGRSLIVRGEPGSGRRRCSIT
jgi:hypothetical protein